MNSVSGNTFSWPDWVKANSGVAPGGTMTGSGMNLNVANGGSYNVPTVTVTQVTAC